MKISEYNINYNNINKAHVALIKKQLEGDIEIPIRFYKHDGENWIIDGGHTYLAYQELSKIPKIQIEVPYTTPADMIALSRHCNNNRIIQKPITYATSIVNEIKLRLDLDNNVISSIFSKYAQMKQRGDGSVVADVCNNESVLESIFKNEQITIGTFRTDYLPLLQLPEQLRVAVDNGKISKSAGGILAHIKDPDEQKKLGNVILEEQLSVSEIKEIKENIDQTNCSIEHAAANILEARMIRRRMQSPEGIIKIIQSKAREKKTNKKEDTISSFSVICEKCKKKLIIEHLEPSGKHRFYFDPLSESIGARVTDTIDEYITEQSRKTGMPKSRITRDLLDLGFEYKHKNKKEM
jgi:hypothetical protein